MAVSERARVLAGGLALAFLLGGGVAAQSPVCSDTPAANQRIDCRQGSGSADDIRIDATNVTIPATATHAIHARHSGSGDIDVDLSGGSLTTTGERDYAVIGWHSGARGDIDIGLKGMVVRTSNADSHAVLGYSQGGTRAVRLDVQGGSVTSKGLGLYGVHAWASDSRGTGDVEMGVAGTVVTMERRLARAVFAETRGRATSPSRYRTARSPGRTESGASASMPFTAGTAASPSTYRAKPSLPRKAGTAPASMPVTPRPGRPPTRTPPSI